MAIAEKIKLLFYDRHKLGEMKKVAINSINNGFTWDDYGNRYVEFLKSLN